MARLTALVITPQLAAAGGVQQYQKHGPPSDE